MKRLVLFYLGLCLSLSAIAGQGHRWTIAPDGAIVWKVAQGTSHEDHIEMSGQMISVVLRYGVTALGQWKLDRSLVLPMLRMKPNKTQNHLQQRIDVDIATAVTPGQQMLLDERVEEVRLDGRMRVESTFSCMYRRKRVPRSVGLTRLCYPSATKACYLEEYIYRNLTDHDIELRVPQLRLCYDTPEKQGVYGGYRVDVALSRHGSFTLAPHDSLSFCALFRARRIADGQPADIDIVAERQARADLLRQWHDNLVLETPDTVLNTMFAFAKIRAAESIYRTKGGLMHGPGGEAYYAAIWANDQAEYINPFFPFLGYDIGNQSALNAFLHFARYMNADYKALPSSIIAEGTGVWHGAKDRGDAAMIAYGAARYALARGDAAEAKRLWPLVSWCLEYCRRQLTSDGVVASNSDELENRFPAGNANLCTSSLYYDALRSAVMLGRELRVRPDSLEAYQRQAQALETAIEHYFGYTIEGYHCYRYYAGNEVLRSWICIPLTMGIYTRAKGTIDALLSPRLWTGNGLLTQAGTDTYWDRATLYALRGILAAGETKRGLPLLHDYSATRLLGEHVPYAIEAWPEGDQRHLSAESGLYCRIMTEGLFGIRPTGLATFDLTPRLPEGWSHMALRHVRAFGHDFDIEVRRKRALLVVTIDDAAAGIHLRRIAKEGHPLHIRLS